ncbi:MAG: DUF4236 domain-containing protein [Candidatus Syntrophonatronum acetioxidans]|uniref:DUF4236 domain-containing protein n=1 Tax=Candidatus Syntrophonatronum acetioxidans TaxID=1795816 RepID=A0A424YGJ5_9FIRM|nr:MAG: DUF4236 domain-containing protein [Candidatus Syntrophonatronum acetioxidans]
MGLRFRRSMNLGGGLRLNLSKSGIGISGGGRGARIGTGPRGQRMAVGIPGTGLFYEKRSSHRKTKEKDIKAARQKDKPPSQKEIKLGFIQSLLTPRAEKLFVQGINHVVSNKREEGINTLRESIRENNSLADSYFALALVTIDEKERLECIKKLIHYRKEFNKHFSKYKAVFGALLSVTDHVSLYIYNDDLGLELLSAEVLEEHGFIKEAIELLNNSIYKNEPALRLSLGELYFRNGQYQECIETLQGIENNDMIGTNAIYYKGLAFKEMEMLTAAVETLRKARRRRKNRDPEIIKEIRYALAETLLANNRKREAQKEFERIMTEDSTYRDVAQRIQELKNN